MEPYHLLTSSSHEWICGAPLYRLSTQDWAVAEEMLDSLQL